MVDDTTPAVPQRALRSRRGARTLRRMPSAPEPDHVRAAHAQQIAIVRAMTPGQRLERAIQMNRTMRELMAAGFRARHPDWSEGRIRRAVADRILHARTG